MIFEKGTKVPYKKIDELASVWCEWAEMELRHKSVSIVLLNLFTSLTVLCTVNIEILKAVEPDHMKLTGKGASINIAHV